MTSSIFSNSILSLSSLSIILRSSLFKRYSGALSLRSEKSSHRFESNSFNVSLIKSYLFGLLLGSLASLNSFFGFGGACFGLWICWTWTGASNTNSKFPGTFTITPRSDCFYPHFFLSTFLFTSLLSDFAYLDFGLESSLGAAFINPICCIAGWGLWT